MKAILISIRPQWCEKIASGKKTIEVRKSAPKEVPFKAYIYCTKGKDGYEWLYRVDNNGYDKAQSWHDKVIGEFICDKVERFTVGSLRSDDIEKLACLSYNEMISYFYKPEELDGKTVKQGFAWHISDLKIYDKPKEFGQNIIRGKIMTDLEYDLSQSLEWWTPNPYFEDDAEVDCEETAKNLTKLGYQKIVWHDAKKELPELNKNVSAYSEYVLSYDTKNDKFAVVSWDGTDWSDDNAICYDVDYWTELPKFSK